jgi:putative transposase
MRRQTMAVGQNTTAAEAVGRALVDEHADLLKEAVHYVLHELMEEEASRLAGARLGERADERTTYRNGYRQRDLNTRVGTIELAIPKLRQGSYLPTFLDARKRSEKALVAAVQECYVNGVSTRKVERIVEQMGMHGISKDAVSRLCKGLDEQVEAFLNRPLDGRYPYLWLDGKIEKVRDGGQVRRKCLAVAYAVSEYGVREVIGIDVGEVEAEVFWREFLRGLKARGLSGVALCVSDAHDGLKNAVAQVLGCPWQRCTVHFLRDMLGHCRKEQQGLVCAAVRQVFNAEDTPAAQDKLAEVVERLEDGVPKVAELLLEAETDLLAFYDFPKEHWRQLRSTNPLERVNKEIGRRTDVVGIFPNDASLIRLVGSLLIEQNDEWLVGRRYMSLESLASVYDRGDPDSRDDTEAKRLEVKT